jgi:hypothetical protein
MPLKQKTLILTLNNLETDLLYLTCCMLVLGVINPPKWTKWTTLGYIWASNVDFRHIFMKEKLLIGNAIETNNFNVDNDPLFD